MTQWQRTLDADRQVQSHIEIGTNLINKPPVHERFAPSAKRPGVQVDLEDDDRA